MPAQHIVGRMEKLVRNQAVYRAKPGVLTQPPRRMNRLPRFRHHQHFHRLIGGNKHQAELIKPCLLISIYAFLAVMRILRLVRRPMDRIAITARQPGLVNLCINAAEAADVTDYFSGGRG